MFQRRDIREWIAVGLCIAAYALGFALMTKHDAFTMSDGACDVTTGFNLGVVLVCGSLVGVLVAFVSSRGGIIRSVIGVVGVVGLFVAVSLLSLIHI